MDPMDTDHTPYGQRCALPVPAGLLPGDAAQAPESGEQYMLRVRLERASIPNVVAVARRTQQPRARSSTPETGPPPLPSILQPTEEWLAGFARHLAKERARLAAVIAGLDVPADFVIPGWAQQRKWKSLCYSGGSGPGADRAMLYTLASMDQPAALWLIRLMQSWMATDQLRRAEGAWLWFLILRLDGLLDHDDTHTLRQLCRKLVAILAAIGQTVGHNTQGTLTVRGDEIAAINILIAAITRGYGQRDIEPWTRC
ncbi:hypothetical protein IWQ57_001541 [Coemansia nantahalensis]|uniref:Uncharacterized protein n=1 Tax=Coemansia nantahalensis TaxID=2789366 RepID=A0ACC1K3V4_9FUNG|nr:hypothetical protein IWQ57_001541 [Coemansia nantahalensis]